MRGPASLIGRDQHALRDAERRHEALLAVEQDAAAFAARARRGSGGIRRAGVDQRGGQDRLAARQRGQPALALLRGPRARERKAGQRQRGEHRHRRHRAPGLLEQRAQLEEAEAHAALRLGHRDAQQIGGGELRPQLRRVVRARRLDRA